MRTTVTIDDRTFEELLRLAATDNKTKAVNTAIAAYIRAERLRRFKELRGHLGYLPSNEDLEAPDLERARRLAHEETDGARE